MDPAATTPAESAPPAAQERKKPGRPPLDADAREKAAQRAAVRKLARAAQGASTADEFFQKVEDLRAKREGREPRKVGAPLEERKPVDPLDVPIRKGGPTPRQVEAVRPAVNAALDVVQVVTTGTRYDVLTETLPFLTDSEGKPRTKRDMIGESGAVLAAELTKGELPDIPPGWMFALSVGFAFGPPAAMHAYEVFGPKVRAWWGGPKANDQQAEKRTDAPEKAAEVVKFEAKKGA